MGDPKKATGTGAESQRCTPSAACCETIRETAYYKWEAAGSPCSDGLEFWLQAEAELAVENQVEIETSKT